PVQEVEAHRIEVLGGIEAAHLRAVAEAQAGRVDRLDRGDAGAPGAQRRPGLRRVPTDRGDGADAGDRDAPRAVHEAEGAACGCGDLAPRRRTPSTTSGTVRTDFAASSGIEMSSRVSSSKSMVIVSRESIPSSARDASRSIRSGGTCLTSASAETTAWTT